MSKGGISGRPCSESFILRILTQLRPELPVKQLRAKGVMEVRWKRVYALMILSGKRSGEY